MFIGKKFLATLLWLVIAIAITIACQHQRVENGSEALKVGKDVTCEEPQFEMKYKLSEVMPTYIDLGVDMTRAEGAFSARLGDGELEDTEIRLEIRPEGLLATIAVLQPSGLLEKQAEGFLVDRYGKDDPFMLVIENGGEDGDPLQITVKAREMSERRNRGIIKDNAVSALMPDVNPKYLQVSSHHRGLIVTEGSKVKELFFMKNGSQRGRTISLRQFQDIAEDYLLCLGKNQKSKGEQQQIYDK